MIFKLSNVCSSRMTTNTQNTGSQTNPTASAGKTNPTASAGKTKQTEIGALWKRQSQKGQKYLAGTIKYDEMGQKVEVKVVVFPVDNKTNPNSPDFRIYLSNAPSKTADNTRATTVKSAAPTKSEPEEEIL